MSQTSVKLDEKLAQIEAERLEDEARAAAQAAALPYLDLRTFPVDNAALFLIDESAAHAAGLAAIAKTGPLITIALLNPQSAGVAEITKDLANQGFQTRLMVTSLAGLTTAWNRYRFKHIADPRAPGIIEMSTDDLEQFKTKIKTIGDLKDKIISLPVTEVLDTLIAGALTIGASDIHFEPEEKAVRLRYRLDGVLTDVVDFGRSGYPSILSRVKLTSGLKINIHATPQDGRFTIRLSAIGTGGSASPGGGKDIEVRVSILPGAYGENIVMRILDPATIRQKLEELGMRPDTLEKIKRILQKTTGAILTTGPTGSGKTTTLYAFIQFVNTPDVKIITIEDPIEYHIEGISQTQVNETAGYTFAEGLRSIVRQDPDVILVGEIRDKETAEITMQAALTGHLVLTTLHTNNAAGTIPRLVDLGLRPVTIAPAINAAMAQRLVRRLCEHCKEERALSPEDAALLKKYLPDHKLPDKIFYPKGCPTCSGTGYKGRIGVYEIFEIDAEMQKLILTSPAQADVEELAAKKGLITMLQDAFKKVLDGVTSIEEAMRVIGE